MRALVVVAVLGGCSIDTSDQTQAVGVRYQVGPTRTYHSLGAVASLLKPGDIVEVDGNATYPAVRFTKPGTASAKITIRGLAVSGKRPVISGGTNTVHFQLADHYVFENFDVTAGTSRCIFHEADDITIRNTVVHDCPQHGLLGADNNSGSLTLETSEFHHNGSGDQRHQIYMATDEEAHPGSVFRMQFCYVHDGNGGNNVKSRAERNEIYYNWLETAFYHELELIGPDPAGGVPATLEREDSDVVGNVLRKTPAKNFFMVRFGGDGTGETNGRYRFVNNTVIVGDASRAVFRLFDGLESVEMHNNVFFNPSGGVLLVRDADAQWTNGRVIGGSRNWVSQGSTAVPPEWQGTVTGTSPGFANLAAFDLTPTAQSALIDKGGATTSPAGHAFPNPLAAPLFMPPPRSAQAGVARPMLGPIDLGASEYGSGGTGGGGGSGSGGMCTPTTCMAQGKNCGSITDGCGGMLTCGSCSAPQTCGGGGTANVCGASSNLVTNSGFETGLMGWDSYQATLAQVATPHSGTSAARVCATASSYTIDDAPNTVTSPAAGSTYAGSVWVRAATGSPTVQLVLRERSATGSANSRSTAITADGTWRQLTATRTLTTAAPTALELYVEGGGAGTCFLVDDIFLTRQ